MALRRTVLLETMLLDVASPSERREYESLYEKRNKGSATAFALRIVKKHWDKMISLKQKSTSPLPTSGRQIKITGGGQSWYEHL